MLMFFLFIGIGVFLLYIGAGSIVTSSSRVARRMGLSDLWIGLTIVAFGTSLPELVVGFMSNLSPEAQGLTLSNIAGANINNITLILGISGLISPLTIREKTTRREISFMILAGVVFYIMALSGNVMSRVEGIILLVFFAYFTFTCCVIDFFKEPPVCRPGRVTDEMQLEIDAERKPLALDIFLIIFGIAALGFGGEITKNNAVNLANYLNIPKTVIGATIVSLGTTLPELFTSVMAASKGKLDISIGNIVGSCIFNMLMVGGIAAVTRPIAVNTSLLMLDFPVMLLTSIIVIPMISPDFHIDKTESVILLLCYVFYVFTSYIR